MSPPPNSTEIEFAQSSIKRLSEGERLVTCPMETAGLMEASANGDVPALLASLQEDPLLLDKILASCALSSTPLHAASLRCHAAVVRELLGMRPEMASERDYDGNSPLHLAAARGHAEIAAELVSADPGAARARNLEGRTPLHVAAIKGRVDVVDRLLEWVNGAQLAMVVTDRGETALHMAVAENRLEVVERVLLAVGMREGRAWAAELLNWRDCDGNSVLHVAVAKKQIETIKFLLTIPGVKLNQINNNDSTPLDVLKQSTRDLKDMEIEDCLLNFGALSSKSIFSLIHDPAMDPDTDPGQVIVPQLSREAPTSPLLTWQKYPSRKKPTVRRKHTDWLGRKRSALMVVASLIATVAFQAATTPPGGVWQDDLTVDANGQPLKDPRYAGTSIMAHNKKKEYGLFMIFNTIAFLASLSIILLLVSGLPIKRRRWMWVQMVIMWIAISALVGTYFIALKHMSPDDAKPMLKDVTETALLAWLCLMLVVFFGNVVRIILWVLKKHGYIKGKKDKGLSDEEDEAGEGDELEEA